MTDFQNKARREGYAPPPFYYLDRQPDYGRIVAWSPSAEQISQAVGSLLQTFPQKVQVLLKTWVQEEDQAEGLCIRYYGVASLTELQSVIGEHLRYVFQVGGDVLCLRKYRAAEYLALDEYGTLFYYTDSEKTFPLFESCGFLPEQHPFVDEGDCYLQAFADQDTWRQKFIQQLKLQPVPGDEGPEVQPR